LSKVCDEQKNDNCIINGLYEILNVPACAQH